MSDVFEANGNGGQVELIVNGSSKGRVSTGGQTLGDFVKAQATRYGIRTFSVYLDGQKAYTEDSGRTISASKVEISAKDSRGCLPVEQEQKSTEHGMKETPTPQPQPEQEPVAA